MRHLLVVATPVEVVLLAVSYTGGDYNGQIALLPSKKNSMSRCAL